MHDERTTSSSEVSSLRIFVAGATGVIGSRLLPLLTRAGHTVAGMTRTAGKAPLVRKLGAEPVVCDVYDAPALTDAVRDFRPDLLLHQLTDLPDSAEELPERRAGNARIRVEGTGNLIAAARAAGCERFLAQSVAWELPPEHGGEAVRTLEEAVLDFGGVVLRYGQFHGPGTFYPESPPTGPRVHIDTAAARTVAVLDHPSGIVTITDETSASD
ncbi:NAD-dependent epimerase/dehydratase family protein [Saccharomonospora glauca]|jgi:nucleoside-diphosphate-sugar epimerase|uniref:NAD dependent epimerase/dehydratase family protein n=1 Tax=Saccharomonospora glauca K62 TaxID=928724 RepID=I1D5J1_9PSEU|nr:NAD-dependent epimerase/dehydratase family protein [Saccharomonospora glauca]EIF00216.1 NAD dependent epimerase/dehydratase family protein [Saccharomonospora glauca K62]